MPGRLLSLLAHPRSHGNEECFMHTNLAGFCTCVLLQIRHPMHSMSFVCNTLTSWHTGFRPEPRNAQGGRAGQSLLTQACYQVSLNCTCTNAKAMQHTTIVLLLCSLSDTTSLHCYSSACVSSFVSEHLNSDIFFMQCQPCSMSNIVTTLHQSSLT